jgi:hypothetical protein
MIRNVQFLITPGKPNALSPITDGLADQYLIPETVLYSALRRPNWLA